MIERALRWPEYKLSALPTAQVQRNFPLKTLGEMVEHLKAQDALFVDARPVADYDFGHIPTASSLPIDAEIPAGEQRRLQSQTRPVIVYCDGANCRASKDVAMRLYNSGVKTVFLFPGGMQDWRAAGMPVQQSN